MDDPLSIEAIQDAIIEIRGQQVLLDSDVARIYGIQTKRINEAVRNNSDKFPNEYLIRMTREEWQQLKTKFSTSKRGGKGDDSVLRSKFSTAKFSKTRSIPKAFPERGLYMLATILKSPRAIQATFCIIETFTKFRELTKTLHSLQSADRIPPGSKPLAWGRRPRDIP